MNNKSVYIIMQRHIEKLEEICTQLQNLFLDIYSNQEVSLEDQGIIESVPIKQTHQINGH